MYTTLLTSLDHGVFTVTINRPDKLNALNRDVMNDLDKVIDQIESDPAIRVVILTGSGQKGFVAGADIGEFVGLSGAQGSELAKRGQDVFFRIERCTKPVIAAVNGFALGGGCELAMACHFRIASENAKFGQPEVNLGLIPGYGGTQRLVQLIGKGRALELLLTGNMIDASIALEYGLVNHVVPQDDLLPKARMICDIIVAKAPLAISRCISSANAVFDAEDGYEKEINAFGECFESEDMKEGTSAFLEKRKANFKGK
jgi:enoyl-CoA hydratase